MAFAQVVREIANTRLLFLGDGELKEELSGRVETLGLENHLLFLRMCNDVPEIISCSDLFVLNGETGVLVPLKDLVPLDRGIIQLLKDPSLALQMAECGYQR